MRHKCRIIKFDSWANQTQVNPVYKQEPLILVGLTFSQLLEHWEGFCFSKMFLQLRYLTTLNCWKLYFHSFILAVLSFLFAQFSLRRSLLISWTRCNKANSRLCILFCDPWHFLSLRKELWVMWRLGLTHENWLESYKL